MRYVNQTTNTIHYIADIRRENPNVSIPDDADCTDFGYEFLIESPAPQQDGFQARELPPVNNVQQWELVAVPVVVPQSITARQTRLVLLSLGLLDDVDALVAADRAYQITWEYATEIERNNPILIALATQLNMTDVQIDNLFIAGAKL